MTNIVLVLCPGPSSWPRRSAGDEETTKALIRHFPGKRFIRIESLQEVQAYRTSVEVALVQEPQPTDMISPLDYLAMCLEKWGYKVTRILLSTQERVANDI